MHLYSGAEEAGVGGGVISMKRMFALNVFAHQLNGARKTVTFSPINDHFRDKENLGKMFKHSHS